MESQNAPSPAEASLVKMPLLPLWATVGKTYSTIWRYRTEYLKIVWCWFLLTAIFVYLYSFFAWPYLREGACWLFDSVKIGIDSARNGTEINPTSVPHPDLKNFHLLEAPMDLFALFAGSSVAVAWHRLILRQEKIVSSQYLRRDALVRDYFSFGLLFWVPTWLTYLIPETWKVVTLVLLAILMIVYTRMPIILPARALGSKEVTLKKVWEKTSWNFWRIFWGWLLVCLPMLVCIFISQYGCTSNITGPIMYTLNLLYTVFIVVPFSLTFLSLAYQHFFERETL